MTDQSASDPLLVTQVNGVTLQEQWNMGSSNSTSYATEATPIPLGALSQYPGLNYSVSMPGVVQWNSTTPSNLTVYSNAFGNVTLTVQAGGLNYPTQYTSSATANLVNAASAPSASGMIGFYTDTNGDSGTIPMYISYNSVKPTPSQMGNVDISSSNIQLQGILSWTGSGVGTTSGTTPSAGTNSTTTSYFTRTPTASFVLSGAYVQGVVASNVTSVNITDVTTFINNQTISATAFASGVVMAGAKQGDLLFLTPVINGSPFLADSVQIYVQAGQYSIF
jgi:hypothetical protein